MRSLALLKPYLRKYRRAYLLGTVAVILSTVFMNLKPRVVQLAIDRLKPAQGGVDIGFLALCGAGIVGLMIVRGYFMFLVRQYMIVASRYVENDLRDQLFRTLERHAPAFFQAHPTGDLMARATNDLAAVRQVMGPGIMYSVNTLLSGGFALANLVLISPFLSLVSLAVLPLMAFSVWWFGGAIHRQFAKIQAQFGRITAHSQENIAGARVVRSYVREEHEQAIFREANLEYVKLNRSYVILEAAFRPTTMFIMGLGALVFLYAGGNLLMEGRLTLGEFTAFSIYLAMLAWPAISIGWVTGIFQRGAASMKRIQEIFDAQPEIEDQGSAQPLPPGRHAIEIRGLDFRYRPDGPLVLKGVSARIEPGTTTALVGPTGAGKTTLLNLLVRLYPVERGRIFVGGRDVNDVTLKSLRGAFGFVPQEVFLFSDTIASNIAFARNDGDGADDAADPAVAAAAVAAAFHEEVAAFPAGYATMLGERGINLSGGQKQRCAIARALLKDPEILVLDDALSAVDTRTEDEILRNLKPAAAGKTVIIVSHRISAVRDADQILVLRGGSVVERGRHEELVRAGGLYAAMVEQQRLQSEIEVLG